MLDSFSGRRIDVAEIAEGAPDLLLPDLFGLPPNRVVELGTQVAL